MFFRVDGCGILSTRHPLKVEVEVVHQGSPQHDRDDGIPRHPKSWISFLLVIFDGFDPMGFIPMKPPFGIHVRENMFTLR